MEQRQRGIRGLFNSLLANVPRRRDKVELATLD